MDRRHLTLLALLALVLLWPAHAPWAAQGAGRLDLIQVSDGAQERRFTLPQALEFLRCGYTDMAQVKDPLAYAHDLCLRGKLLAYFLSHSAELARGGYFEARGPEVRQAVLASLNPQFVSREMARTLTPKDIMALHAVVYATSGPALHEQFMAEKVAGAALEGKDFTYLAELRHYAVEAAEHIQRVRALSGMYGEPPAELKAACASQAAAPKEAHECSGTCQTAGKCSGTCAGHEKEGDHKCSGACTGHGQEGADHKCSGTCQTAGKCSGACSGKCPSDKGASLILPVN